jgi:hypothetical protein
MTTQRNRLVTIQDESFNEPAAQMPPPPQAPQLNVHNEQARQEAVAVNAWHLVGLGLRVLSQRTVQLASHLLPLIALTLGFFLVWAIRENPSPLQLLLVLLYGAFSVILILCRR